MSTVKRISGDYTIQSINSDSNVMVQTHTLNVVGNLLVSGDLTSVTSGNLAITDNTILLNQGETGAGVTLVYSGIEIDRGTEATVSLRWDESEGAWQATEDGTTWKFLLQSNVGSGGLTSLVDDTAPTLGGNLNITNYTIYDTNSAVVFYADTVGSGTTGLYVDNNTNQNKELISKTRALVYSLIM